MMARPVPREGEATTYEFQAPTSPTPGGGREEQDWRDQLFAIGLGVLIVTAAVLVVGPRHPLTSVLCLVGGIYIGIGWDRYKLMKPEDSLFGGE